MIGVMPSPSIPELLPLGDRILIEVREDGPRQALLLHRRSHTPPTGTHWG